MNKQNTSTVKNGEIWDQKEWLLALKPTVTSPSKMALKVSKLDQSFHQRDQEKYIMIFIEFKDNCVIQRTKKMHPFLFSITQPLLQSFTRGGKCSSTVTRPKKLLTWQGTAPLCIIGTRWRDGARKRYFWTRSSHCMIYSSQIAPSLRRYYYATWLETHFEAWWGKFSHGCRILFAWPCN